MSGPLLVQISAGRSLTAPVRPEARNASLRTQSFYEHLSSPDEFDGEPPRVTEAHKVDPAVPGACAKVRLRSEIGPDFLYSTLSPLFFRDGGDTAEGLESRRKSKKRVR